MALDPEKNRLYAKAADLHPFHWEKLAARNWEEAARAAGAALEGGRYFLRLAGSDLAVDPERREVSLIADPRKDPGYQRALVAVACLANAIDAPPSDTLVSPRELPGGHGFFRGPHAIPTAPVAGRFRTDAEGFLLAGERLGGARTQGGDAAFSLRLLPKIPAKVILWLSDGEMESEAAILVEARSHLFLPLDVLWAALNVLSREIAAGG